MSYETFAYYYDSLMDPKFYDDYQEFIEKHATFEEVFELGCGTGETAIRLAKQGYAVYGTDLSSDMLEVAKQKAMAENVTLQLQRVDMRDFTTSRPVDLILCLCDSLNYLLNKEDVLKTFQNVYHSISESGTFIFDVNSLYKMNTILKDYHESDEDNEFAFRWDVENKKDGYVEHHVYIEDKIEKEVVDEIHLQQTYSVDTYIDLLKQAGFSDISYYSDFHEYQEECERITFVCHKKG